MKPTAANLALQQASAVCEAHRVGLTDALVDLEQRRLAPADLEHLGKEDRRLLDQFAYRYTRLRDDMGARLMPAILRALDEEITAMPAIDRLNRLEQLGWLPSAEEWAELRRIRNEFSQEVPGNTAGKVRTPAACRYQRPQAARSPRCFRWEEQQRFVPLQPGRPDSPRGQ